MEVENSHISQPIQEVHSLFSIHRKELLEYGLKISSNQEMVEDVIQDLFLKFCENENLTLGIKNPKSYLQVSMKRELISRLEKARKTEGPTMIEISVPSYEQLLIENQKSVQDSLLIKECMASLSPSQKTVLTLRFYKGLSYDEIAIKMGSSKRTVYNQVHDSIKKMRKSIKK